MNNISRAFICRHGLPRKFAFSPSHPLWTNPSIRIAKRFPVSTCIHDISSWKRRDPLPAIREKTGSFPFLPVSSPLFSPHLAIVSRSLLPRRCLFRFSLGCPGGPYESFNSIFLPDSALPCNPRRGAPSFEIHLFGPPRTRSHFPPLWDYPEYVQFGRWHWRIYYLLSISKSQDRSMCATNGDLCFINVRGTQRSRLAVIPSLNCIIRGIESPKGLSKHTYSKYVQCSLSLWETKNF